jgi:multiple sugar transport system substrate-binding protein
MGRIRDDRALRVRALVVLRLALACATVVAAGAIAAGCGASANAANGPVELGLTTGRDPTGWQQQVIRQCNASSHGKWKITEIVLPPTVDAQREQIIRRLAGQDSSMSIIAADVIWTAEFSEAGWLVDLTNRVKPMENQFVPAAIDTVKYHGKYWAVPYGVQVAMLYYRKDIIKTPPKTWEEMASQAKAAMKTHPGMAGFVWQANQYEGLTVDALEYILAAGGHDLSPDGKTAIFDKGDGTQHAYEFMRSLFTSGVTPKAVTTFQEEESRQMFQQGNAIFMRNWPYVWQLAQGPDSKVKGKIGVEALPKFEGRGSAGVIGGGNYAISRYTPNAEYAWQAVDCLSNEEHQRSRLVAKGDEPSREALYQDPALQKQFPFMVALRKGLDNGHPRPVTPYYNDVTTPINRISHEVVAGSISPEAAAHKLDHSVQLAVDGKGEI